MQKPKQKQKANADAKADAEAKAKSKKQQQRAKAKAEAKVEAKSSRETNVKNSQKKLKNARKIGVPVLNTSHPIQLLAVNPAGRPPATLSAVARHTSHRHR